MIDKDLALSTSTFFPALSAFLLIREGMTFTANSYLSLHVCRLPSCLRFAYTRKRLETSEQLATIISNMAAKRR